MYHCALAVEANASASAATKAVATTHRRLNLVRTCTVLVEEHGVAQASGRGERASIRTFGQCRGRRRLTRTALRAAADGPVDRQAGSERASRRSSPCRVCTAPRAVRPVTKP